MDGMDRSWMEWTKGGLEILLAFAGFPRTRILVNNL